MLVAVACRGVLEEDDVLVAVACLGVFVAEDVLVSEELPCLVAEDVVEIHILNGNALRLFT